MSSPPPLSPIPAQFQVSPGLSGTDSSSSPLHRLEQAWGVLETELGTAMSSFVSSLQTLSCWIDFYLCQADKLIEDMRRLENAERRRYFVRCEQLQGIHSLLQHSLSLTHGVLSGISSSSPRDSRSNLHSAPAIPLAQDPADYVMTCQHVIHLSGIKAYDELITALNAIEIHAITLFEDSSEDARAHFEGESKQCRQYAVKRQLLYNKLVVIQSFGSMCRVMKVAFDTYPLNIERSSDSHLLESTECLFLSDINVFQRATIIAKDDATDDYVLELSDTSEILQTSRARLRPLE